MQMPELRQNPATKEWVIISVGRAKRPEEFVSHLRKARARVAYKKGCPFCPGNEELTPQATLFYRARGNGADSTSWRVRVVPNKFPALSGVGSLERQRLGPFIRMAGVGYHEVIIESSHHNQAIATMSNEEVEDVLRAYRARFCALIERPEVQQVIVFKNHGPLAGTSLGHPHSQLIATPVLPRHLRQRVTMAEGYYNDNGRCVYCDVIKQEMDEGARVVGHNEHFVALEPFASRSPFETWILPLAHASSFGDISEGEISSLAAILRLVIYKLYALLNDPDYNYVIYTAPYSGLQVNYYHWSLEIIPRLTTPAGFEMGSGIYINVTRPEECAESLRSVGLPDGFSL